MKPYIHKIVLLITLGFIIGCHEGTLTTDNYSTGQLWHVFYVKDKKIVGVDKEYHINGQLKSEVNYVDGKKDGLAKEYYEDGHLLAEMIFKNDKQVDTMKLFYDNGKLMEISYFIEGYKTGPLMDFYSNGALKIRGNFRLGIFRLYDSVTDVLSNIAVCDTTCGIHYIYGDSTDFKLTRISTEDSGMHISVPSKWAVLYNQKVNYKNHPRVINILAAKIGEGVDTSKYNFSYKEAKKGDTARPMIIVIWHTDNSKTSVHDILVILRNDFEQSGSILKEVPVTDTTIDGCEASFMHYIGQDSGVQSAIVNIFIKHNNTIYNIMCKSSPEKFPFYIDLYYEIIKGITFAKNKTL
ncbi:MAG TPA: hypothetical protein VK809_10745 [Bacteroidia bacterium]|jgi:hypothetical protein|nr:hypothetical protein [Bacteroidia bacterium]